MLSHPITRRSANRLVKTVLITVAFACAADGSSRQSVAGDSDAAAKFRFRDVAQAAGLLPAALKIQGHGAGWGDVDGDGWADLYVGTFHYADTQPNLFFRNRAGRFELDEQPQLRISTRATGVVFADLDNDGDLDLYVGSMPAAADSKLAARMGHAFAGCSLFRNDGGGRFTDVSAGNAACPAAFGGRSATVLDFNGDGLLDLLVGEDPIPGYNGSPTKSSRLFRNDGSLQFTDVSREAGLPEQTAGLGVAAADVNQDGWPDMFLASSAGNHLFLNDGRGRFREAPGSRDVFAWPTSGGDDMVCGVAIGDVNGDTLPDVVLGQHYSAPWLKPVANRLYLNRGVTDGVPKFEDVTDAAGLIPLPLKAPHVEIQDFDNDGRPDIYTSIVTFADGEPHPVIFRNLGNHDGLPRFQEAALGVNDFPTDADRAIKRSGTFFEKMIADRKIIYAAPGPSCDFDRDGRLDLFLANWWADAASLLLRNETEGGHWLDVRVAGGNGVNRMGVGSRVDVYAAGQAGKVDGLLASREIATGYGYASSQEAVAHFGLGARTECDVVVLLPHGKGRIVSERVKANQRIVIAASGSTSDETQREADSRESSVDWPPALRGAKRGTVAVTSPAFLEVPEEVQKLREGPQAAPFVVAQSPPTVHFAFHDNLGTNAVERRLWSSWGDICVAGDGSVYCGIGDHGNDVGGDARCFVYRWNPQEKLLEQIIDMNKVVPPADGQPAWSKIHAKIDEGADGRIYFSCTLNDGNRAKRPDHKWNDRLPGGQLYQFDPTSGQTRVFASLPPRRCTATSLLDRQRNVWWCNLEAGDGNALWGLSLASGKPVLQTPDGSLGFNRAFALRSDGSLLCNGETSLRVLDPKTGTITETKSAFSDSPGMRCATRESQAGFLYGVSYKTNQLFRYSPERDELSMLGPTWLDGSYTTVCLLSPNERFLYYLPGAHGKAFESGTPVIQYEIISGQRKVLAFLAPTLEREYGYVPAGTYGAKLSDDGSTLYVNFNGHAADRIRPTHMRPNGFGLCSFAEIAIPESER